MPESETQLQQTQHLVSVRLPDAQYQSLARDSAALGMSLAYNSMLVSGRSTYKYLVAYTIHDQNIGCFGCNEDQAYYNSDNVHPTDGGQQILAKIICNSFNTAGDYGSCPRDAERR
jgi:hypothetical protein